MYYILEMKNPEDHEIMRLDKVSSYAESWISGARFTKENEPSGDLELEIDEDMGGDILSDFYKIPVPLMKLNMLEVLQSVGVFSVDTYPAVILGSENNERVEDYVAFNVIGMMSVQDVEKSVISDDGTDMQTGLDIDSYVVDSSLTKNLKMFRINESRSTIVVDETVKDALESANILGIYFYTFDEKFSGVVA